MKIDDRAYTYHQKYLTRHLVSMLFGRVTALRCGVFTA